MDCPKYPTTPPQALYPPQDLLTPSVSPFGNVPPMENE